MNHKRSSGSPLSPADAAWLKMDEPTNPMTITAVLAFDEMPEMDVLVRFVERFCDDHARFRQRIEFADDLLGTAHWVLDERFDVHRHIESGRLERGDDRELRERIGESMSVPLDATRPLWRMHVLEGPNRRGAIIVRLQHSIGDGVSLVSVLESMSGAQRMEAPAAEAPVPVTPLAARIARRGLKLLAHPRRVAGLARESVRGTRSLVRTVLFEREPETVLKGPIGMSKRCAWSRPIPLARLRALAAACDGTINDVLMAALAGALREYLSARSEPVEGLELRTLLTVNLRPPDSDPELGNRFGLVYLPLPVGVERPADRLSRVKARMDAIKASREAPMILYLIGAAGWLLPAELEHGLVAFFGRKATLVATNLRGPSEPVMFAGKPISRLLVWAPQSGRLGVGVSLLSYAGQLTVGVGSDAGVVPDPESLSAGIERALDQLALELGATSRAEAGLQPASGPVSTPRMAG